MPKSTILVVDKEKILVDLLVRALLSDDIRAFGTTSTEEALRLLEMQSPALVVIDPTIPSGFNLLDAVVLSKAKALVVSGSPDTAERARMAGVREVVDRNAGLESLVEAIRRTLNNAFQVMGNAGGVSVLVTDDEDEIRNVLSEFLAHKGYNVRNAKTVSSPTLNTEFQFLMSCISATSDNRLNRQRGRTGNCTT